MIMADWLFRWTDVNGDTLDIPILNARITLAKDAKTNSAEIVISKKESIIANNSKFTEGESIKIYAKNGLINDSPTTDDLIGTFKILNTEISPDDSILKLICSDLTYDMLSTLFTRDITEAQSLTSPTIINNIVQENANLGIRQTEVTTNIDTTKSDLTAFPNKPFVSLWKTSYDCISELSQIEYTEDDQPYLFWFDPDGTFNWTYPPSTLESFELIQKTEEILSIKHSKAEAETINMIIYDAGTDLNGDQILDFELRQDAGTIKGSTRYIPMTKIAPELKLSWVGLDNSLFLQAVKNQAKAKCASIFSKTGQGLDKAIVEVKGRRVNIAKLHKVSSDMKSLDNLRLEKVIHTFSRNGWQTRLELMTDPTEL